MPTPPATPHTKLSPPQQDELKKLFDRGLQAGSNGAPDGTMCIQQAIAMVVDGSFTDRPACVSPVDRHFLVQLNDADWDYKEQRAEAMWPLALACVGTVDQDRKVWINHVIMNLAQTVLSRMAEEAGFPEIAKKCKEVTLLAEVEAVSDELRSAALYQYEDLPVSFERQNIKHVSDAANVLNLAALFQENGLDISVIARASQITEYAVAMLGEDALLLIVDAAKKAYANAL